MALKKEYEKTGRIPPQDLEAEKAVLGGLLNSNESIGPVLEHMKSEDFYREAHGKIFDAMLTLYEKREPFDLLTLPNLLKARSELDAVGGVTYLASLADAVASAANIGHYAKIVADKALLRRMIEATGEVRSKAFEGVEDLNEFTDQTERIIFEVTGRKHRSSYVLLKDLVTAGFEHIERLHQEKRDITGVPTGFIELDKLLGGLQPSNLIVVAARPSMGKTSLCMNIALNAALRTKSPVLVFSLEMSNIELTWRMLAAEARVDLSRLSHGRLYAEEWDKLPRAANKLYEAPLYVDDSGILSVLDVRSKARRLMSEKGLGLIVIDYLQLMKGSGRTDSREQEVSEMSRSLKALSKELSIPVIALSQLNRSPEKRTDQRPQLSDLRESGAIEQDADVIAFIYRDEMYKKESPDAGKAEIIVAKHRNGPTNTIMLRFAKEFTRFENLASE